MKNRFLGALVAGGLALTTKAADNHPNILFIAVDDLKPTLGCYGDKLAITPNIDALAERGTVFLKNYCQWAVCGPSRACLMTGLMPEVTGVMGFKQMRAQLPNLVTLPQYFRQHGYETAATGKVNDPRCVTGGRQTDDEPSWSIPYRPIRHTGLYRQEKNNAYAAPDVKEDQLVDGRICKAALILLNKLAKQPRPFFLAVGFKKPHLPFIAPKKYWDLYDRKQFKLAEQRTKPLNGTSHTWHSSKEFRRYANIPKTGPIPDQLQLTAIHGYYACTSYIDAQIGKLIAELARLKLTQRTIICIWGDHGFHLGDHGLWGKHTNIEQATRAPLIITIPGNKSGATESPTAFLDIYPTLTELAGLPIPDYVQGKSLVPIFKNPQASVHNGVFSLFSRHGLGYAYRTKRYRYIEVFNRQGEVVARELYDYQEDPLEKENLAAKPVHAALIKKLATAMRQEAVGCLRLKK